MSHTSLTDAQIDARARAYARDHRVNYSEALDHVVAFAEPQSARVADVLAAGSAAARTSIAGLADGLSYAAPIAKSVGLSLESTVAIMAQFSNAGIDASRAGSALNSILSQFSDPASKFRKELSALGINTGDFDQALKQLAATGGSGAAAILSVGTEAGPALRAALNLGIPALEKLRGELYGAEGEAAAMAKTMGNNLIRESIADLVAQGNFSAGVAAGLRQIIDFVVTALEADALMARVAGNGFIFDGTLSVADAVQRAHDLRELLRF